MSYQLIAARRPSSGGLPAGFAGTPSGIKSPAIYAHGAARLSVWCYPGSRITWAAYASPAP